MLPQELTLIVAATSKMGIGKAGTLPWTGLKNEMAYFARVTKRAESGVLPLPLPSHPSPSLPKSKAKLTLVKGIEHSNHGPQNLG